MKRVLNIKIVIKGCDDNIEEALEVLKTGIEDGVKDVNYCTTDTKLTLWSVDNK